MQRPTGVTILAVLCFLGAAVLLMAAMLFMAGGVLLSHVIATGPGAEWLVGLGGAVVGGTLLVIGILDLVMGIGFLKLHHLRGPERAWLGWRTAIHVRSLPSAADVSPCCYGGDRYLDSDLFVPASREAGLWGGQLLSSSQRTSELCGTAPFLRSFQLTCASDP
jgi:hypothetical protein